MYAISINYGRTYLQLSVRAVDTSVNNDSRIKRLTVLFI